MPAPSVSPTVSPPPERVGSYVLVRRIGSGGMGEVWLGHHVVSGGLAAVKRLAPHAQLRDQLAAYFSREGRALARLAHPHVVPVFEVGDDYLVSGFVDGPNLARRLHTPIEPAEALHIARQIADALGHAHDRGVVHRDVKPSNILIDPLGNAYLADFGLAQVIGEDDEATRAAGTPQFMAPEQRRGEPVGPAADQYALGRTLLEMLVGHRVPIDRDAALGELPAQLPEPLRAAVARATERDPAARFASVHAFAAAVRDVELGALAPPRKLAAAVREPTPFAWLAAAHRTVAIGPDVDRADYRLGDLVAAGLVRAEAAAAYFAATGLRELGFAIWGSPARLGPITDPMALARASDLVVLMHGWSGTRESWAQVAAGVCRDNARAIVIALDLHGFGESVFDGVPTAAQASIAAIASAVEDWRRLLGLVAIPTALVGHSMSGLALLGMDDERVGPQTSRVAINPILLSHDAAMRRRFRRIGIATATVGRIGPVRRAAIRQLAKSPDMRTIAPDVLARGIAEMMRMPAGVVARLMRTFGATPETVGRRRRVALMYSLDDPLIDYSALDRLIAEVAIASPLVYPMSSGGHSPHIESRDNPEWQVRNLADIVRVIDSMLITAGEPTTGGSPSGVETTMPASGGVDTHLP